MKEVDPVAALRAFVEKAGGQKAAAAKLGCSPQFVGQVYHGHRRMPDSMMERLGLKRSVVAEK